MTWVYLDDGFPDHPKIAQAGGDAGWLFVCGLAYCKRQETKGRIPVAQVPRLSDRKQPMKLAAKLLEVGLWERDGDFFLIHDFDEWNRPEESRKAAARKAAQARWDRERDAKAHADASEPQCERMPSAPADRCPTPLPLPSSSSSSSSEPLLVPAGSEEEDPIASEVWALLAQHDAQAFVAQGNTIRSRRWFEVAADTRRTAHAGQLRALSSEHPDWTPTQLVEAILVVPKRGDTEVAAMLGIMERNRRRLDGEACPHCADTGWLETDVGMVQCRHADVA